MHCLCKSIRQNNDSSLLICPFSYVVSSGLACIFTAFETFATNSWSEQILLNSIWLVSWGLPVYLVGSFLQLCFSHEITTIPQRNKSFVSGRPLSYNIAEGVYGSILSITYLAQIYIFSWVLANLVPAVISTFISTTVNVIMIAWATSFAAFEPQMISRQKSLSQRIDFFERHWDYALGYGLCAGLAYNLMPSIFATGTWQFLQLLLTLRITLISLRQRTDVKNRERLRIFKVAELLAKHVIYYFDTLLRFFF